jgi:hypothetical protein
LVIEFAEHLQIVTTSNYSAIANSHTLCSSLQHVLSLLSLLCFHQLLPGDGSQQCPLLPCSRSYRLVTVPQLIKSQTCPAYNIWHGPHIKHLSQQLFYCCVTQLSHGPRRERRFSVRPLVRVRNLMPSNGRCLESLLSSGSTRFNMCVYVCARMQYSLQVHRRRLLDK